MRQNRSHPPTQHQARAASWPLRGLGIGAVAGVALLAGLLLWTAPGMFAYQVTENAFVGPGGFNTSATATYPSGLEVTISVGGELEDNGPITHGTRGGASSIFDPGIPVDEPARDHRAAWSEDCDEEGLCPDRGTLTIDFSDPVVDPVLHFSGIGGWASAGDNLQSHITNIYRLTNPGGLSMEVLPGAENLAVTGDTIQAEEFAAGVRCDEVGVGNYPAEDVAGCGSVRVNGTVDSLTFEIDVWLETNPQADGPQVTEATADAVALSVSVDEDFGWLPETYEDGDAARATLSDLRLGQDVEPDNVDVANASAGVDVPEGGDDGVASFPPLTTTMAGDTYEVDFTMSGASDDAIVCGWIDFSGSSTFDNPGERACTNVSPGQTDGTLAFTVPGNVQGGDTFARLRIGYDTTGNQSPTGAVAGGEVEDYALSIDDAPSIAITKTADEDDALTPGGEVTYMVTVANTGNVDATDVLVEDPIPNGIESWAWTCDGDACPNESGSSDLSETIPTLPAGASVVYTIEADVEDDPPSVVANTATVTGPEITCEDGSNVPCSSTVTNPPSPMVDIAKTADPAGPLAPGETVTYTVVASNVGAVNADDVTITDELPAGLEDAAWTCDGAACDAAEGDMPLGETVDLDAGESVTYTIVAQVVDDPPAEIVNTAELTGDLFCADGSVAPCSSTTTNQTAPVIDVNKTADPEDTLEPGGTVTYTITVDNLSIADATDVVVEDPLPDGIVSGDWACIGDDCPQASGAMPLDETIPVLTGQSGVVYTIEAEVAGDPPPVISNTVTVTGSNLVCTDGSGAPCSSTVTNPPAPVLDITKTADPSGALTPGGTVTYTVTVSNVGSVDAEDVEVTDELPEGIDSGDWTCSGAACPNASGDMPLAETLDTLPPGAEVVYTIEGQVSAEPPQVVINTAEVTGPEAVCADGSGAPCMSTTSNPPAPVLDISKSAEPEGTLTPGGAVSYTVTVTNTGSVAAADVEISDALPDGIVAGEWTCAGDDCADGSGDMPLSQQIDELPAGASLVYTIDAEVADDPPAEITNTATVTGPGIFCTDQGPLPCSSTVTNETGPIIEISKSASTDQVVAGAPITYEVIVTNIGQADAGGTEISDPLVDGLIEATWLCEADGGALCPADAGDMPLAETIDTFPAGGEVRYTITATFAADPPNQVTNTATAIPPEGGVCADGSAAPCEDSTTTGSPPPPTLPTPTPTPEPTPTPDPGPTPTPTPEPEPTPTPVPSEPTPDPTTPPDATATPDVPDSDVPGPDASDPDVSDPDVSDADVSEPGAPAPADTGHGAGHAAGERSSPLAWVLIGIVFSAGLGAATRLVMHRPHRT